MKDSEQKPLLRASEAGQLPVQLNILGDFVLSDGDGHQYPISTKKNRALLAILALSPGFQATRERLCGLLWGDRGDDQARSSLRQSLAVLRKELGQIEELVLKTHDDIVALRRDTVQIDAVEFLALSNNSEIIALREAAKLYRGELLSNTSVRDEAFEDWLSTERSRLRTVAIKIFDRLVPLEEGHSRIVAAQQLVSLDPLRESSHRLLMQAYADQGDNGLALKQFELCRKLLHEELSVEPAAETQVLRTAIAKGTLFKVEAAAGLSKVAGFDRNPAVPTDKPSIAVLPFANLTSDPHQEFLCDGISQNITDDLARFHDLVVIASDSAFVYRNRNASIQAMSQDLGARYLLQGSIATSGNHLRIQARLVDGKSGQQAWSESYDGHPDSIFSLQDSVTKTIASTLATAYGGRLLKAWERRPDRAATRSMQAIDLFQRGMQSLNRFTKEDNEIARRLFQEAAQQDSNYAKPLAKAAWTHMVDRYFGWSSNPQASLQASLELARKAVSTDPDEPWAYWALSGYYQQEGDFERAIAGYEKALELNPNDADVVTDYGWCLSLAGRAEEGLAMAQKAMRLNPHHPDWYIFQFAQLQFNAKKYRDAVNTTKRLREVDTASAQLYLAASYAALGEVKNASMAVTRALELDPQASIERYTSRDMAQYQVAADLDHFRECLRKAGLPETSNSSLASVDEKPSIAVLPFDNMSGDPKQDYFAEGIAEDITTELSRFRQFKIQARTAAALFHGSEAEALNAGRELGVRYFVTGSVRRLGQRLRISIQLVDARTGSQVWAERFDRSEEDLFAVQDEVIRTIVSTLAGRAEAAGAEQTKRRHPGSLGAYECVLRAETLPLYDHKSQIEARALYEKAIGLDPAYARPHAMLANLYVIDWMEDMSGSDTILDRALELAKKSVLLDDNDATCQMTLGAIYSNLRSFQLADHHYRRAMDLNRNNPLVVATVGTLHLYRGDAVNAVKVFEEARILDPFFEPSWYWPTLGIARFALGQYHEAIALLERSPNRPHWVTAYLAASFALIGEEHRASQAAAETQRTLPSFLPERFTAKEWPPESDVGRKLLDGLRKAGLPERSNYVLARTDEKPTIAVLPFINLSGDPQHDYFADGITEDITTELSRFKGLFVIARNSAFSFKAKSVAVAAIAKELGVRFLLEGSVRRPSDRIRVTARLVDAEAGGEVWAERYDRVIEDIFAVQDDVVRTIVATLEGQLASTVASQSRRQTPSNILSYECVLQARKFLDVYDAQSAEPLLRSAIAADPRYAQAHAWMAMVYWVKFFNDHREKDIAEAVAFGKTAVALDPGDSICHMQLGFAYIFARQLELADIHSLKALELNPADMLALGLRAQLLCRLGRSQEAIEALDQLVRHDPFPPNWYWENRSIVLLTLDKFEDALAAIRHMPELFWWDHCYVAICFAKLGQLKESQDAINRALKLLPGLTIQRFMVGEPFKLPEDANRMVEGLRMAGLAEHPTVASTRSGTKPSIAVLSFVNLSGDAQQDYLADGLAEDVIAGLSRFSSLVVISRNSSFRFRDGSADAKTVGHELGVQYLVAGSLRRKGQQIRITAQLIETASGAQLWTEKYERNVEDFLEVQDDVVRAIVTTFEHRIADIRASEISHQPTSNWVAYDYFLKARQMMSQYSNYAAAEEPLRRAIELDPSFSEAYARLAHVTMSKYWANGDRKHIEQAFTHAKTAIRLNDQNSAAHTAMCVVSAFMNNYDLAFLHADRALELNPNNTQAAKNRAMWQVYVGKSAEALAAFDIILMRDPYPTANSWEIKGVALFQLRRYEEAIKVFSMFSELQHWHRAYLIASHIRLGNKSDAKKEVSALLQLHPDISISRILQAENYADEVSREHLRQALLEAGLPEHQDISEAEVGH